MSKEKRSPLSTDPPLEAGLCSRPCIREPPCWGSNLPGRTLGLAGSIQTSHLSSWYLSFLIYKLGMVVVVTVGYVLNHPHQVPSTRPGTTKSLHRLLSHFCPTESHPPFSHWSSELSSPILFQMLLCHLFANMSIWFQIKMLLSQSRNKTQAGGRIKRLTDMLVNSKIFLKAGYR